MKTVLTIISLLIFFLSNAQNTINGTVKDADTGEPIAWADVILYEQETLVNGVITSENGTFSFKDLTQKRFTLKVSYLGYKTHEQIISIDNNHTIELNIQLTPSNTQLDQVVIQAEVTTIQYKSDRKIVNVGKDLLATGTVAGEILGQLPSVKVDEENNISLRGDQNVKILVDGKSSSLPNDRILQQIPSDAIARIELINNPSAKYQAEGLSGIINIITKKSYRKGGKVNINTGFGTGEKPRINSGLGVSYATEKFKFSVDYNYNKGFFSFEDKEIEERETISFLSNTNTSQTFELPYYLKGGLDFFIDSTSTLSTSIEVSKFRFNRNLETMSQQRSNIDQTTTDLLFNADNGGGGNNTSYNINYRKEFEGSSHYFESDINYSTSPFNFFSSRITTGDNFNELQNEDFNNMSNILTLSSDYYNNNPKRTLEFGLRAELRNLDESQLRTFTNTTTTEIQNKYDYNDGIYAAYGVYDTKIGNLGVKLGLRLEHTNLKLNANESKLQNDYTNLFPSASFSFNKDDHNFSLNYSRRISRPSFWVISNKTIQQDQYTQFMGNPELQPEFANKIEFNYSKNFSGIDVNTSIFITNRENTIRSVQTINGNNIIYSFDNVGGSNLFGLELYTRLKPTKWWSTTINATYYYSKFQEVQFLNDHTFRQDYSINNTFKPFNGFSIQANINIEPKYTSLQSDNKGIAFASMAISKDIFNSKGNISLRLNDIFNSKKTRRVGEVNGLSFERTSLTTSSRHLYLSFRYNLSFGNKELAGKNRKRKNRQYTQRQ